MGTVCLKKSEKDRELDSSFHSDDSRNFQT